MNHAEILTACHNHESTGVHLMLSFAIENAGVRGFPNNTEDRAAVVYHVAFLVDSRMVEQMTDADYATVTAWLKSK